MPRNALSAEIDELTYIVALPSSARYKSSSYSYWRKGLAVPHAAATKALREPRPRRQAPRHRSELLSPGELRFAEARRQPVADSRNQCGAAGGKHGVDIGSCDPGAGKDVAHHGVDVVECFGDLVGELRIGRLKPGLKRASRVPSGCE